MTTLPTGCITFLFTDIEGSTVLWEQWPTAMRAALARHDALLEETMTAHGGVVFKRMGDAFCVAFADPAAAVAAAAAAQQALHAAPWPELPAPLRVRMALHRGDADQRDGDYFGGVLNRVARLLAVGHGGQVLCSARVVEALDGNLPAGAHLRDLGQHRLKDLQQPEALAQLELPDLPLTFPPLRSLDHLPNNLPAALSSFVGRTHELAEMRHLLAGARLLTLVGMGGAGKTRVALHLAADLLDRYPDGVWLVELAPITTPEGVAPAIAEALSLSLTSAHPLAELTTHLAAKHLLLVLDNCEHLITPAATVAETLLRGCAHLRVLATSREPLRVGGEATFRLPTLACPDPAGAALPPEALAQFAAVRLFLERAQAVQPAFRITTATAPAITVICCQLDGIPLALELAAARLRALSVDAVAAHLSDRFRLLTGGSRTALPRQQTLRAAIEWSYTLLSADEQLVLRRLALLPNGTELPMLEAICGDRLDAWDVLDILAQLVDKSLVLTEEQPRSGTTRYRMLETIRHYALEHLRATGEEDLVYARYVAERVAYINQYFQQQPESLPCMYDDANEMKNAAQVLTYLIAHEQREPAMMIYARNPNKLEQFDTAMARWLLMEEVRPTPTAVRVLRCLAQHQHPTLAHESRVAMERALQWAESIDDWDLVCLILCDLALWRQECGDWVGAAEYLAQAESAALRVGDEELRREVRQARADTALLQGDLAAALQVRQEESRWLREQLKTNFQGWGHPLAISLIKMGQIHSAAGDFSAARAALNEGCRLFQEVTEQLPAYGLRFLAEVACAEGHYTEARHIIEVIRADPMFLTPRAATYLQEDLAALARGEGREATAVALLGASDAQRIRVGTVRAPIEQQAYDRLATALRAELGDEAYQRAYAEGQGWDIATSYARGLAEA